MAEKKINGRLVNKHDKESNWQLAVNFTPMAGEVIIYDPDENVAYARMKIGDGKTLVNDLPFVTVDTISIDEIDAICGAAIYAAEDVMY